MRADVASGRRAPGTSSGRGGDNPEAEFNRAVGLLRAGNHKKAAKIADSLARKFSDVAAIRQLQGTIALAGGDPKKAIRALEKGLAAAPGAAPLSDLYGTALTQTGRYDEAIDAHLKALAAQPDDPGFLNNLGNALKKAGRMEEARDAYARSLKRRPGHPDTEINLGGALEKLGDFEGAEAAFARAIGAKPEDAGAHSGLARALMAQNRTAEAKKAAARTLALDPGQAEAHEVMGTCYFLEGNLDAAWEDYEWRWRDHSKVRHAVTAPRWTGEPLQGKVLLAWGEQGAGDEILFAGMVPDLLERGATVVLECDKRLVPLFQRSFPDVRCRAHGADPGAAGRIDFQIPSGSLGRLLRPRLDSFPGRRSYLIADHARRDACRKRYSRGDELVVGVAWRSINPRIGVHKSMTAVDLARLAGVPSVRLIDLQYGDTAAERLAFADATGTEMLHDDAVDQMADLDAFAAQVAAMDLVVSISNTTVHMAGALGVPAWVLLPTRPMWRWMADREDSPWYPSVRLFRQSKAGDWSDVITRVRREITAFVARRA